MRAFLFAFILTVGGCGSLSPTPPLTPYDVETPPPSGADEYSCIGPHGPLPPRSGVIITRPYAKAQIPPNGQADLVARIPSSSQVTALHCYRMESSLISIRSIAAP